MKEDEDLCAKQWNDKHNGKRPAPAWDNAGTRLSKPSSGLLQRLTFLSCCATNVGKGGVHQWGAVVGWEWKNCTLAFFLTQTVSMMK
jgi:hypothetical protein